MALKWGQGGRSANFYDYPQCINFPEYFGQNTKPKLGFHLNANSVKKNKVYKVKKVDPGSPAAIHGMKVGDLILSINGVMTENMDLNEFCSYLTDAINIYDNEQRFEMEVLSRLRSPNSKFSDIFNDVGDKLNGIVKKINFSR